ncbi:MAG: hypothetical protein KC419_17300 [Anaerolineales bacterium]|nr:hypothetical protein [Anaerolineales bacterium]MCA9930245.1 hypothetical protein [Anaerolineales bacterium]
MDFSLDLILVAFGPRWELWWPKAAWLNLTPDEQTAVAARQCALLFTGADQQQERNDNEQTSRSHPIGG